jgi:hypothetical protein
MIALLVLVLSVCVAGEAFLPFATHTPYSHQVQPDWPATCSSQPSSVYLLSRHGIREPNKKLIQKISRMHVKPATLPWLASWKNPFLSVFADDLVMRGVLELRAAGKRLRHRMNMTRVLDESYHARSTFVRRAARSGVAFCAGFESDAPSAPFVSMQPTVHDGLLRPFQVCAPFARSLSNKHLTHEHVLFGKIHFPAMARELSSKTGLELKHIDVGLFWQVCAYERALWNVTNKFCTLFEPHHHELMSYWSDLQTYWQRGYGNNM